MRTNDIIVDQLFALLYERRLHGIISKRFIALIYPTLQKYIISPHFTHEQRIDCDLSDIVRIILQSCVFKHNAFIVPEPYHVLVFLTFDRDIFKSSRLICVTPSAAVSHLSHRSIVVGQRDFYAVYDQERLEKEVFVCILLFICSAYLFCDKQIIRCRGDIEPSAQIS